LRRPAFFLAGLAQVLLALTRPSQRLWIVFMMCRSTGRVPGSLTNRRSWSRPVLAVALAASALLVAACGSTSTTSVGPTPLKCELALQAASDAVSGGGGTRTVAIGAPPECSWRASAQVAWITGVTPAAGQGNGQLTFSVAANTGVARSGSLLIGEQAVTVNQEAGCSFTVNPAAHNNVPATAVSRVSTVTTGSGCTWSASSSVSWLTVTPGANAATINVAANTGPARTGTVTIAGRAVTVSQVTGCTYAISPASRSFGMPGGSQAISVTAQPGCQWTASVQAGVNWVSIASGASGTGNGSVTYTVAPAIGARRTATITIAGRTHTITQN
jgi:hypothetical protein